MGKSSINGPFSTAMLNNQRVTVYIDYFGFKQQTGYDTKATADP